MRGDDEKSIALCWTTASIKAGNASNIEKNITNIEIYFVILNHDRAIGRATIWRCFFRSSDVNSDKIFVEIDAG